MNRLSFVKFKVRLFLVILSLLFFACSSKIQNQKGELQGERSRKISDFLKPEEPIYCNVIEESSDYTEDIDRIQDIYASVWNTEKKKNSLSLGNRSSISGIKYLYGDSVSFNYEDKGYYYKFNKSPWGEYTCYRYKKASFSKARPARRLIKCYVAAENLNIRAGPGTKYKKIYSLTDLQSVSVLLEEKGVIPQDTWVKMKVYDKYGGGWGWVYSEFLAVSLDDASEKIRAARIKKYNWSYKIKKTVLENKIILGMTKQQVIESWGSPDDINETVGSWGVHEQWVYRKGNFDAAYLYFENGVLKSWQK